MKRKSENLILLKTLGFLGMVCAITSCGKSFDSSGNVALSSRTSSLLYSTSASGTVTLTCPDGQAPLLDSINPCPTSSMPTPTPISTATPTPTATPVGSVDLTSVIECELGAPNVKITLSQDLSGGSNAENSRVCMSENACLNLVNTYAEARNCSLSLGLPTTLSAQNCTGIFPGSKGTCHKAQVLSDDEVANLLKKMAN